MNDAHTTAILHSLYWRAGGRKTASLAGMLRRIVDDGSHLHRQQAFPAGFEAVVLGLLANERAGYDEELRLDMLELACEAGYSELAARLLDAGPALTSESAALCMATAISSQQVAVLDALLKAGLSPHIRDDAGVPMFSHAIASGNTDIIERLIAAGAGPDQEGHALATAAIGGDADLLRLCLARGASQEALDDAFTLATAGQQFDAMAILLDAGACAESALRQARQVGDEDRALLIRSLLFAQGRYDQLLSLEEIKAAALALLSPAADLTKRN